MMSGPEDDVFNGAKFLPTCSDLVKVALSRGLSRRDTYGGSKRLSKILGIPLVFNPSYVERAPPPRPSNDTLRSLAGARRSCENVYGSCGCIRTVLRDTSTGEEFEFYAAKYACDALGTRSKKLLESWGLSVNEHHPQRYSSRRDGWDGGVGQAVYEAIHFGVGFRD